VKDSAHSIGAALPLRQPSTFTPQTGLMHILVTRPLEDSQRTVEALIALGHQALVVPLFEIRPLPYALPEKPDCLLATSANALHVCDHAAFAPWGDIPFFSVGEATASAAREFGFLNVISADSDSLGLAALIRKKVALGASVLQLAGKPRRDAAIQALKPDYCVSTVETYETVACSQLPDAIAKALENREIDAVLHFSPRASAVFMDLITEVHLAEKAAELHHICISETARDARLKKVSVAAKPTMKAMLEAISDF
jgi:uroporphyrinogen-III synthase